MPDITYLPVLAEYFQVTIEYGRKGENHTVSDDTWHDQKRSNGVLQS